MAFAPARVTPFVMQRLQVPVQVLIYAGLFVCAEYLVNWLHLPLPANLVGMLMMLALIVCRVIPLNGYAPEPAGCWLRCCCFSYRRWWRSSTTRSC